MINSLPTTCEQRAHCSSYPSLAHQRPEGCHACALGICIRNSRKSVWHMSINYCEERGASSSQCVFGASGDRQNKNTSLSPSVFPSFFLSVCPLTHRHTHTHAPQPSSLFSLPSTFRTSFLPLSVLLGGKNFYLQRTLSLFHALPTSGVSGRGIKICIILERNRAVTPWTQGRGEQLLAWRAVNWQHLLWEIICSPTSLSTCHVGREGEGEKEGGRRRQVQKTGRIWWRCGEV